MYHKMLNQGIYSEAIELEILSSEEEVSVLKTLDTDTVVVFCSPIPAMMKLLDGWFVFHNDAREKVELPNGKIIMKVAEKGWQLV